MGIQLWRGYRNGSSDPKVAGAARGARERVALQRIADTLLRKRAAASDRFQQLARLPASLTRRCPTTESRALDTAPVEVTHTTTRLTSLRLGLAVGAVAVTHRLLGWGQRLWKRHPTAIALGGAYVIGLGIPLMRQPEVLQPMTTVWSGISVLTLALHWSPPFARRFERWFLAPPSYSDATSANAASTTAETEQPSVSI